MWKTGEIRSKTRKIAKKPRDNFRLKKCKVSIRCGGCLIFDGFLLLESFLLNNFQFVNIYTAKALEHGELISVSFENEPLFQGTPICSEKIRSPFILNNMGYRSQIKVELNNNDLAQIDQFLKSIF